MEPITSEPTVNTRLSGNEAESMDAEFPVALA